jgi:hypothetical protein
MFPVCPVGVCLLCEGGLSVYIAFHLAVCVLSLVHHSAKSIAQGLVKKRAGLAQKRPPRMSPDEKRLIREMHFDRTFLSISDLLDNRFPNMALSLIPLA